MECFFYDDDNYTAKEKSSILGELLDKDEKTPEELEKQTWLLVEINKNGLLTEFLFYRLSQSTTSTTLSKKVDSKWYWIGGVGLLLVIFTYAFFSL